MPSFTEVTCRCGRRVRATSEQVGETVRCWDCGSEVPVPVPNSSGRLLAGFAGTARETFQVESLSFVAITAAGLTVLLSLPHLGLYVAIGVLVVAARYFQHHSRAGDRSRAEAADAADEPAPWFVWSLSALTVAGLVAPFVVRSQVRFPSAAAAWGVLGPLFALWAVAPVALFLAKARDRLGPIPPGAALASLASRPSSTFVALLILPIGFVVLEALVVTVATAQGQLFDLVDSAYPPSILKDNGDNIIHRFIYDDLAVDIPRGDEAPFGGLVYRTGLKRGFTLAGQLPVSLARATEVSVSMDSLEELGLIELMIRGTLVVLVLTGAGILLSIQARCLGLIGALAPDRAPAGAAPPPREPRPAPQPGYAEAPAPPPGHNAAGRGPVATPQAAGAAARPAVATAPAPGRPRPSVLVVDGDRGFAAGLGRILSDRGFAAYLATTANEAVAIARGARPDLVVLDMALPDRAGSELCLELRAPGPLGDRPILIATSQKATAEEIAMMARSADDYLVKPYVIDALVARINTHLDRRPD